jgi:hypothetical protein
MAGDERLNRPSRSRVRPNLDWTKCRNPALLSGQTAIDDPRAAGKHQGPGYFRPQRPSGSEGGPWSHSPNDRNS